MNIDLIYKIFLQKLKLEQFKKGKTLIDGRNSDRKIFILLSGSAKRISIKVNKKLNQKPKIPFGFSNTPRATNRHRSTKQSAQNSPQSTRQNSPQSHDFSSFAAAAKKNLTQIRRKSQSSPRRRKSLSPVVMNDLIEDDLQSALDTPRAKVPSNPAAAKSKFATKKATIFYEGDEPKFSFSSVAAQLSTVNTAVIRFKNHKKGRNGAQDSQPQSQAASSESNDDDSDNEKDPEQVGESEIGSQNRITPSEQIDSSAKQPKFLLNFDENSIPQRQSAFGQKKGRGSELLSKLFESKKKYGDNEFEDNSGKAFKVKLLKKFNRGDMLGSDAFNKTLMKDNFVVSREDETFALTFSRFDFEQAITEAENSEKQKVYFFLDFFKKQIPKNVKQFAYHWNPQQFGPNQVIYEQNEKANKLFIMMEGSIAIEKIIDYSEFPRSEKVLDSSQHLKLNFHKHDKKTYQMALLSNPHVLGEEVLLQGTKDDDEGQLAKRQYKAIAGKFGAKCLEIDAEIYHDIKDLYYLITQDMVAEARKMLHWRYLRIQQFVDLHLQEQKAKFQQRHLQKGKKSLKTIRLSKIVDNQKKGQAKFQSLTNPTAPYMSTESVDERATLTTRGDEITTNRAQLSSIRRTNPRIAQLSLGTLQTTDTTSPFENERSRDKSSSRLQLPEPRRSDVKKYFRNTKQDVLSFETRILKKQGRQNQRVDLNMIRELKEIQAIQNSIDGRSHSKERVGSISPNMKYYINSSQRETSRERGSLDLTAKKQSKDMSRLNHELGLSSIDPTGGINTSCTGIPMELRHSMNTSSIPPSDKSYILRRRLLERGLQSQIPREGQNNPNEYISLAGVFPQKPIDKKLIKQFEKYPVPTVNPNEQPNLSQVKLDQISAEYNLKMDTDIEPKTTKSIANLDKMLNHMDKLYKGAKTSSGSQQLKIVIPQRHREPPKKLRQPLPQVRSVDNIRRGGNVAQLKSRLKEIEDVRLQYSEDQRSHGFSVSKQKMHSVSEILPFKQQQNKIPLRQKIPKLKF